MLEAVEKQIALLDQRIRQLIDADDEFKHLDGLLRSVPGVGPALSAALTADLRELGKAVRGRLIQ